MDPWHRFRSRCAGDCGVHPAGSARCAQQPRRLARSAIAIGQERGCKDSGVEDAISGGIERCAGINSRAGT